MNQFSKKRVLYLFMIYIYVLLSHLYFIFRYSGRWIEWDSAFMVKAIQSVVEQGTIFPTIIYANGFGSQVIASFVINILNITVQEYSIFLHPIITTLYVFIAYLTFLELSKKKSVALLSTFLISLQPDFFFTTSRNTHEGFTYLMIFISTYVLVKNLGTKMNFSKFTSYAIIYYISILCLITQNVFFAASYSISLLFVFIMGYLISRKIQAYTNFRRVIYSSGIVIILIFFYILYIYYPAEAFLNFSANYLEKIGKLMFIIESQSTPQYTSIFKMWRYPYIWFLLTLFNWIIAVFSFTMYLKLLKSFFRTKSPTYSPGLLALLLLYTAFSFLLVVYIIADRFGGFASNIELRVFPILMIYAVPLASMLILEIINSYSLSQRKKIFAKTCLILILLLFIGNSLLKGTNDPSVCNKWMYYSLQEEYGIIWVDNYLFGKTICVDFDERLSNVYHLKTDLNSYRRVNFSTKPDAEYIFVSKLIEKRAQILDFPVPKYKESEIIYDNGDVEITSPNNMI